MKKIIPLLAAFFLTLPIILTGCLEQKPKESILPNGLKVVTKEIKDTDVVALDIYVRVGSADEDGKNSGISHFTEHMLFKGTRGREPGEASRLIESVGGYWNGATSRDFTRYYAVVPKRYLDLALDCLADAIMNPLMLESELERERMVVVEEIRRSKDNPTSYLWTLTYKTAFRRHPYRLPILGSRQVVEKVNRQEMLDWHHTHYIPNNMTLVICGDFKTRRILPKVKKVFSGFRARSLPDPPAIAFPTESGWRAGKKAPYEPSERKMKFITEERDINQTYMTISFSAPGIKSQKDVYAMDVLLYLLGMGRGSRLYQVIREQKQLASQIDVSFLTQRDPGIFVIHAIGEYEKSSRLVVAILDEIKKLREELVSAEELARAKNLLASEYIFGNETALQQANTLGFYETLTGGLKFEKTYLDEITKVERKDIRRVINRYLDIQNYNVVILKPRL